jgi:DNA-binding winged helix-turn-helix (wHTH) protein
MSDQRGKVMSFGPFELSIGNRLPTNGAKVLPLGARNMDLLIVLVEQANEVVGRRALVERVWPKRGAEQVSPHASTTPEGPRSDWAHLQSIY